MNPPQPKQPSQKAISHSSTVVNLAVDPNKWLPQRLDRIEQYAKMNSGSSTRCNQSELDLKISNLKAKIQDEFEKVLGYRKFVKPIPSFSVMDTDKDGKIDYQELAQAMSINAKQAMSIFTKYDANNDGVLDKEEYQKLLSSIHSKSLADRDEDEVMNVSSDAAKSIVKKYYEYSNWEFSNKQSEHGTVDVDESEFRELMLTKAKECEWIRYYDPDNKFHYFYNPNSKQIEWKLASIHTKWHDYNKEQDRDNIDMARFRISCIYDRYTMRYVFKNVQTGQIIPGKPFADN